MLFIRMSAQIVLRLVRLSSNLADTILFLATLLFSPSEEQDEIVLFRTPFHLHQLNCLSLCQKQHSYQSLCLRQCKFKTIVLYICGTFY